MICLLLYWYWLLWDWTQPAQEMIKAVFCFMSIMELGAELVCLIFWLLNRKGLM